MNLIRLVARPLLAAPFIADGWSALRDPSPHVERAEALTPLVEKAGFTLSEDRLTLVTRALGAVTVAAGVALALGKGQRTAAAVLAGAALPLAVVNNPVWQASSREERHDTRQGLTRSLALFGGLLIASTDREGRPSAGWKLNNWREQRAEVTAAKSQAWEDAQRVYAA